jgi:hypothetical protein
LANLDSDSSPSCFQYSVFLKNVKDRLKSWIDSSQAIKNTKLLSGQSIFLGDYVPHSIFLFKIQSQAPDSAGFANHPAISHLTNRISLFATVTDTTYSLGTGQE